MDALSPAALVQRLEWRYAVKKFDPARRIPGDAWAALERALVLTPSSFGLQPWRFVVVRDPAVRERLLPCSWNQRQVVDASHLVVFAIRRGVDAGQVRRFLDRSAALRGTPPGAFEAHGDMIRRFLARPGFAVDTWSTHQVYIALGNFMTAAAAMGIDTCPMEGLDPAKYDAILDLPAQGFATVVAAAAGYRSADDANATLAKVRFPDGEVVTRVG
jgi:nitroreductase